MKLLSTKPLLTLAASLSVAIGVTAAGAVESYDVNRVSSRSSSLDYRPGQLIIKLKETSGKKARIQVNAAGRAVSDQSSVNALLKKYGANRSEALMPLSGAKVSARKARAFNGAIVEDKNLESLYLVELDASKAANLTEVAREFAALGEVEYAEPNYLVYSLGTPAEYTSDPFYSQQWGIPAVGLDKL